MKYSLKESVKRLREYVEMDKIYREFKTNSKFLYSDFELFCIRHCMDIENLLSEVEKNE